MKQTNRDFFRTYISPSVNSVKRELLAIQSALAEKGIAGKTKSLGKIIARIESWQNV